MIFHFKRFSEKRLLVFLLKFLLTAILFYLLFQKVELKKTIESIKRFDIYFFLIALLLNVFRNGFGALRLHVLLKERLYHIPLVILFKDYLIGIFAGFFLPTGLAGDVVRGNTLVKHGIHATKSAGFIIFERLLGIIALLIIPCVTILLTPDLFHTRFFKPFLYISTPLIAIVFIILFSGKTGKVLKKIELQTKPKVFKNILHIATEINEYNKRSHSMWKGFLLSLLYQLGGVLSVYYIALSIDVTLSFRYYLAIVPMIWLIAMLPFTINGFGVREQAFVVLLSIVGVSQEKAVSISFLFIFQMILQAFIGGFLFLSTSRKVKHSEI